MKIRSAGPKFFAVVAFFLPTFAVAAAAQDETSGKSQNAAQSVPAESETFPFDAAGRENSAPEKNGATRCVLSVVDDNDFFGGWSDKYYTNHTRIALTLGSDAPAADGNGVAAENALRSAWFFSIGQEMYAPKDREARIPDERDHPYAGYLYLSVGKTWFDNDFAFSPEIQLGVTGESSYADKIQRRYHAIIDEVKPRGWDTQIHGRAVVQAIADVRKRVMISGKCADGGNAADVIFRGFAGFGNLRGTLSAGTQLRAGLNLPRDFGATNLRQSASVVFDPQVDFSIYGYFDVQVDAIFWDETLTGNNSRGHDIYAYPLAAQATLGICFVYDPFMLSVFQSVRSKDFSSQDKDSFAYGGFKLSVFF